MRACHSRLDRLDRLEAALDKIRKDLPGLAQGLRVRRALLFGSVARGTHDWRSDIDLVVVQDTDLPFLQRGSDIIGALAPGVGIDLLVYTPREWATTLDESRFVRRIAREGEVVYAADT